MPPNNYCDMIIQAWAPAIPNMTALEAQPKKKLLVKQNDSIISQPVFPSYDEMQKSFQAMMEKQKIESKAEIEKQKAEIEKLKAEFETKMTQQSKKSRSPVPPKDYEQMQEFYEGQGDSRWKDISREEAL
ncbi:20136_t:CDS:2, partial [Dentiscutata erythropus]